MVWETMGPRDEQVSHAPWSRGLDILMWETGETKINHSVNQIFTSCPE
jgi:hypothetical protein